MSTRAHIVKKLENGKYIGIYHHSDSYPEYLGQLLLNYYNDEKMLDKLIGLGNISIAGKIPEDDPKLWKQKYNWMTGCFDYESDKCKTYKGRGEEETDACVGELEEFITEDYTYVFENNKWFYYEWKEFKGEL